MTQEITQDIFAPIRNRIARFGEYLRAEGIDAADVAFAEGRLLHSIAIKGLQSAEAELDTIYEGVVREFDVLTSKVTNTSAGAQLIDATEEPAPIDGPVPVDEPAEVVTGGH